MRDMLLALWMQCSLQSALGFTANSIRSPPKALGAFLDADKKCKSAANDVGRRIWKIPAVRPAVVRGRRVGSGLGAGSRWEPPPPLGFASSLNPPSTHTTPHTLGIFIAPTQTFFDYLRTSSPSSIPYCQPLRQSSTNADPFQLRDCWRSWRIRGLMWFNGI